MNATQLMELLTDPRSGVHYDPSRFVYVVQLGEHVLGEIDVRVPPDERLFIQRMWYHRALGLGKEKAT